MSAIHPDLADASVFIIGGASGIGARVALVRRSDAGAFCNQMEEKTGHRPLFIPCDVTDLEKPCAWRWPPQRRPTARCGCW